MRLSTISHLERQLNRLIARGCLRVWHVQDGTRRKQRAADTRSLKRLRHKYEAALVKSDVHRNAAFEKARLYGIPQAA